MCPDELLLLITSIAVRIAREIPQDLLVVYATAFTTLGDALATYAAQCDYLESCSEKNEDFSNVC